MALGVCVHKNYDDGDDRDDAAADMYIYICVCVLN